MKTNVSNIRKGFFIRLFCLDLETAFQEWKGRALIPRKKIPKYLIELGQSFMESEAKKKEKEKITSSTIKNTHHGTPISILSLPQAWHSVDDRPYLSLHVFQNIKVK